MVFLFKISLDHSWFLSYSFGMGVIPQFPRMLVSLQGVPNPSPFDGGISLAKIKGEKNIPMW
jgi:hypothetical protein